MDLRSLADRQHVEYNFGLVQGISSLMDRRTEEGITLPGRICTNRMQEWFELNSFMNTPKVNPGDSLITHAASSPL